MATLVIGVAFIVWFGVRLGMGPLLDLEDAIARRSAQDLTPISRPIPQEVQGIVGRLNALLSDMSATIRAKDSFISNAAHQLRNPISGVVALSEAVAASKTTEDFKVRSADLTEAASHAAKLTEDLLAFERARSAPPPQELPIEEVVTIVRNAVARQQRLAEANGVTVRLTTESDEAYARADTLLLEQAIENLIANALTHGGADLNQVHVGISAGQQRLTITVADNGRGLEPSQFEMALSRFGQVTPGSGSGLGLPIAQAVAEALGGALELTPNASGLCVKIVIPTEDMIQRDLAAASA
ncbi:MAG: HAMP domain-containing sensor histidine kinase [Pseudomonadota bacterium]